MKHNKLIKFYTTCSKTVCAECGGTGCITTDLDDDGNQTCQQECAACGGTGYED